MSGVSSRLSSFLNPGELSVLNCHRCQQSKCVHGTLQWTDWVRPHLTPNVHRIGSGPKPENYISVNVSDDINRHLKLWLEARSWVVFCMIRFILSHPCDHTTANVFPYVHGKCSITWCLSCLFPVLSWCRRAERFPPHVSHNWCMCQYIKSTLKSPELASVNICSGLLSGAERI